MDTMLVTNNEAVLTYYADQFRVEYREDWRYMDVLTRARDLVHRGYALLTHPMSGSLKPNQTPYRTIVLGRETMEDKAPYQDILLMENSILSCEKFFRFRGLPQWPADIRRDFATLDLSFVQGALSRQHSAACGSSH